MLAAQVKTVQSRTFPAALLCFTIPNALRYLWFVFVMGISSGCSAPNSLISGQQFALVSYLPDPLAEFLDSLRSELVPDCTARSHVTILPPRPAQCGPKQALKEIRKNARQFDPFTLRLGEICLFPVSNVVYIEIDAGREKLFEMYRAMNNGGLSYQEAYPFCPHITLAQRLEPEQAQAALEKAQREWKAWQFSRGFQLETLHFVESYDGKCWRDLDTAVLQPHPVFSNATRRGPVAGLYRA
jgi:2'-5' RNA ligase